jgi:hypothetical protein
MRNPNEPDRWMPPMEYAGEGFWIDAEMVGHGAHFYRPHVCDPAQVEAWIARLERIAQVTGDSADLDEVNMREARNQANQESARAAAEKYECNQCGAQVGHPCISQAKGVSTAGKPTKWPHPRRLELSGWRDWRDDVSSDTSATGPTQG